jgi:hypothetical protein
MTTSTEMLAMLRAHYGGTPSKPQPGYLAAEIQAPDSARRADALWLPLHGAQRGQIHGHEIKVSRSDVMVELADPMKAEAWGQFCDRWWLVVADIAMLRDLTIPDSWGIMTPPAGPRSKRLMTIVRPAPPRKPNRDRDAYATVLTRIYYSGDDQGTQMDRVRVQADHDRKRADRAEARARDAERRLMDAGMGPATAAEAVEQRLRKMSEALVHRYAGGRHFDYRSMYELDTITDDEALDLLFETVSARGRITRLNRIADLKLRQLESIRDNSELKALRDELKAATT